MSINSEIHDLTTNLAAAKAAVTTKGGTVGDTGLAGLASEIATIPSGGGGSTDWGRLYFYGSSLGWAWEPQNEGACTVTIEDEQMWYDFCSNQLGYSNDPDFVNPPSLGQSYSIPCSCHTDDDDTWEMSFTTYDGNTYTAYYQASMPEMFTGETGLSFTPDQGETDANFDIYGEYSLVLSSNEYSIDLFEQADLVKLAPDDSGYINIGGIKIYKNAVFRYDFGTNVTSAPAGFLAGCENLHTVDTTYATSLTVIGDNFLAGCYSFNSPIDLSRVTSIGQSFLYNCTSFNQPLNLAGITTTSNIKSNFLANCSQLSSVVTFSGLTSIGENFLINNTRFNTPLSFPNVTLVMDSFLSGCTMFNRTIDLPKVEEIRGSFMGGCTSFNQPFTFPNTLTTAHTAHFFYGCNQLVSTITCNAPAPSVTYANTFATMSQNAPMYTTGITLSGTYASDWKTAHPDENGPSYYRKLILAS